MYDFVVFVASDIWMLFLVFFCVPTKIMYFFGSLFSQLRTAMLAVCRHTSPPGGVQVIYYIFCRLRIHATNQILFFPVSGDVCNASITRWSASHLSVLCLMSTAHPSNESDFIFPVDDFCWRVSCGYDLWMLLRIDNKYVYVCYMDKFVAACVLLSVSRVWSLSIIVQMTYACTCLVYCCAADVRSIIFHSAITMFCMPISVHRMCIHLLACSSVLCGGKLVQIQKCHFFCQVLLFWTFLLYDASDRCSKTAMLKLSEVQRNRTVTSLTHYMAQYVAKQRCVVEVISVTRSSWCCALLRICFALDMPCSFSDFGMCCHGVNETGSFRWCHIGHSGICCQWMA